MVPSLFFILAEEVLVLDGICSEFQSVLNFEVLKFMEVILVASCGRWNGGF